MRTTLRFRSTLILLCTLGGSTLAMADPPMATEMTTAPQPAASVQGRADWSANSHLYMGVGGAAVVPLAQSGGRDFLRAGGGFDVFFGARFNRWVALELDWQPTFHGNNQDIFTSPVTSINLNAATIDVKLHLLRGAIEPYLMVGGGFDLLTESAHIIASGPGFDVGGGVDFWLGRTVSLGIKAQYRGATLYGYDRFNDNTYLSLLNFQAVLTGHFPDAS